MATTSAKPQGSTEIQERQYTNLERAIWHKDFMQALMAFLGTREAAEAFRMEILNQARKSPKLHECTIDSIRFHTLHVARLRLNPALPNEVFFIPRGGECIHQYGYGGLRKLVMRSPDVLDCFTKEVCVNDHFVPPETPISLPIHQLPPRFNPRGRVEGYYAVVQLRGGNWRSLLMSVADVEAHAKRYVTDMSRAPAWSKGMRPDVTDGLTAFDKMALKTCLRMLCNARDIPLTGEVQETLVLEHAEELARTAGAEGHGIHREVPRPALTMGHGVTLEELRQDLGGAMDKEAVAVTLERATRGKKIQRDVPSMGGTPGPVHTTEEPPRQTLRGDSMAWETLVAHRDDATLPADLVERINAALSPLAPASESETYALANELLSFLDRQKEGDAE